WHRGRVLEKRENVCEAFLIDSGQVLVVEETHLASACDELFQLPPKVVLGVFANILPLGEKWAPKAVNYFSSLVGLQITGHVKTVISYKLFVLEVPKIISDALELQLGKLVDEHSFCFIVQTLRGFPQEMPCERVSQLLQEKYPVKFLTFSNSEKPTDFWPVPSHLFPCLPVGSKEIVKITVVISPNKFYCQIQKWQKELKDLTRAMHLYYEAISTENKSSDSLGLLCAAKRQNGQWHRGVIKQHLFDHVEVWFMDFGNTEAVPPSCMQNLKAEFMALPMMSFPCALSCFDSGDETTMKIQLKELSQALIEETSVCVCVDSFNDIKQFYYITLQHQQNEMNAKLSENVNEAAASPALLSETEITSIALNDKLSHERYDSFNNCTGNKHTENCLPELDIPSSRHCRRLEMEINSCHTALVVYVINPSCFWIQVCDYQSEFQVLMRKIEDTYSQCGADEMVLKNPEPGLLCCARYSKDRFYYRGVVVEVLHANITVYFLDFGNEDTLPKYDVKILLPEFSDLPALALCCALAFTTPVDDVWVKKEIDFFKEIVLNKILLFEVIGKQSNKHIVKALFMNGLQQKNVAICMVQAGYAEYLEMVPDSVPKWKKKDWKSPHNKKEKVNPQTISNVCKNKVSRNAKVSRKQESLSLPSILRESVVLSHFGKEGHKISKDKLVLEEQLHYKELVFKPGAVFEVVCSCIVSPENFSCQLQSRVPELNNLMEKIQTYYKNHTSPYKTGQAACIVKYPKDEKWYRATVLQQVSTNEVEVVFVDYGYQERILLKDLQAVVPDFLTLESQAFRCRLKDAPLQTNWSEEVLRHFQDFISSSGGPLTCIIYAVVLVSPNCLYNIVDLQIPSTTAEEFLREHGLAQSEYMELRNLAPLGTLYSFCYSSFNIKIGNEEEVYITHIHSPSKFYCQLNRNSETLEALMRKVSVITSLANNTKYNHSNARLCIARYFEDGLFYRALTFPVESTSCLRVDFVDFGNRSIVERDELMPIPDSATDLIFTPMQAIKCCLSDFKETQVPARVTRWFEEAFYGKLLKAVIVSRASNGKIVVELYDGQLKVSQKIKEKILEELAQKNLKCQAYKYYQPDTGQNFGDEVQTAHSALKLLRGSSKPQTFQSRKNAFSVGLKHRKEPLVGELVSLTLCHPTLNSKEVAVNALSESQGRQNHTGQQEISNENIPKLICQLICLPQHDFQVNSEVVGGMDVICDGKPINLQILHDLNVMLIREAQISDFLRVDDIEEGLECMTKSETNLAWYRSKVIKKFVKEKLMLVVFMDYGNSEMVSLNNAKMLSEKMKSIPKQAVLCKWAWFKRLKKVQIVHVVNALLDNEINVLFLRYLECSHIWEVDILMGEIPLQEHLKRLLSYCQATVGPETTSNTDCKELDTSFRLHSIMWILLHRGRSYPGFATAVTDPSNFCIQFEVLFNCMANLAFLLSDLPDNLPALPEELVAPGASCLIKFELEKQWNRAEISEVTSQSVVLMLIDYGFQKSIPYSDIHKLKVIPESLSYLPHLSHSCSLHGV
ncbi:TDR15 protein, partial [Alcedo cyanopectus]|nr:TDR15 protein [Ceyx cyanopectus]